MIISLTTLKIGLVFFWSLWLSIVFLTNFFEGLKHLGWLPENWKFASQNFQLIQKTMRVYQPPGWLPAVLFIGVILWQALAFLLFWNAFRLLLVSGLSALPQVNTAFAVSLALWAAFMVSDEVFCAYEQQSSHVSLFLAQLLTLLALHLLPLV